MGNPRLYIVNVLLAPYYSDKIKLKKTGVSISKQRRGNPSNIYIQAVF